MTAGLVQVFYLVTHLSVRCFTISKGKPDDGAISLTLARLEKNNIPRTLAGGNHLNSKRK